MSQSARLHPLGANFPLQKAQNNGMDKKTVLVIGASGGIGGVTAALLANAGHNVYNGSRTACGIAGVGERLFDVCDGKAAERAIDTLVEECGGIDWLVYSAGVSLAAPFEHTTEEDMRKVFEVNYFGFARCLRLCLPHMRNAGGGRVVAVSSMGGVFPILFDTFYSASKAALDIMIAELNAELNPYNIYLTSVAPGGTATPFSFHRKIYGEEEAGEYNGAMLKAADSLIGMEQGGDAPELVARQIAHILQSDNPPAHSASGLKNKSLCAARRLLPEAAALAVNKKLYRI